MGWNAFWNGRTTIYVSERHRSVHYQQVADDIVELLPAGASTVLDYGCGDALCAAAVAARCDMLMLCDAAATVRSGLAERFAGENRIRIAAPDDLERLPDASFDVIVANSVLQYVQRAQLPSLLAEWRRLLRPNGRLVLGDLIPRDNGAMTDVTALLRFSYANGFLLASCIGLVRTYFSDYRQKRATLGLLRFTEDEIIDALRRCGIEARRHDANLGHNPARMTIIGRPNGDGIHGEGPAATFSAAPAASERNWTVEAAEELASIGASPAT